MRRLSPALLTMVMLGVVGLLVSMYFAKSMFAKVEQPDPDPIRNIPMALTDLEVGTRITAEHIGTGRARSSSISSQTVISDRVLVGRIVKEPIAAATPIASTSLYPPNEGPPLQLDSGTRALTLSLGGASSGTIRLVRPGQYVDLLFTPTDLPEHDASGGLIMTLFRGLKIVAINGITSGGGGASRDGQQVTFEVTPEQANILLLASGKGQIDITYTGEGKGTGVVAIQDEHRATFNQILGIDPPVDPEKQHGFTTEIYPGSGRGMNTFVDGKMTDRFYIEHQDFRPQDDNTRGTYQPSQQRNNRFQSNPQQSTPQQTPPQPGGTNGAGSREARASLNVGN